MPSKPSPSAPSDTSSSLGADQVFGADQVLASDGVQNERRSFGFAFAFAERLFSRVGWPLFWVLLVIVLLVPTACFLVLAFSPRLFGQGPAWFTLTSFSQALQGVTVRGIIDSITVGSLAAIVGTAIGGGLAWVLQRTTLRAGRVWILGIWAILLLPSYIIAVGWEVVLNQGGILSSLGLYSPTLENLFFGPLGYTLILAIKGAPFAYLAIAGPLAGLSRSYEEAARTHGAGRFTTLKVVIRMLMPAIFAALIIIFAESIADFGTAAVIAPNAHFPVATYTLYTALSSYPANFGIAAVIGWVLVISVGVALFVQNRFTKGRSFAVLGGRTRFTNPQRLGRGSTILVASLVIIFFLSALFIPILGAIASSLLQPFSSFSISHLSFAAYHGILNSSAFGAPLSLSLRMALINAFVTLVIGAIIARRLVARQLGAMAKILNLTLLAAVALPGLVLAAGYIFAYNLPLISNIGIHLYGTLILLGMAYLAGALPSTSRVLMGPMAQVQGSLLSAARVHGANLVSSWRKGVLPLIASSLVWAWLLTFTATFLELPASELLAPPGQKPISVAIIQTLNKSDLFRGTALSVMALLIDLGVVVVVIVGFRILAPSGWRRTSGRVM